MSSQVSQLDAKVSMVNLRKNKQFGQGMMEYIIIVALIAVAAIGVYSMFGKTVRNQTAGLTKEMAGESGKTQIDAAKEAAKAGVTRGDNEKGLGAYDNEVAK